VWGYIDVAVGIGVWLCSGCSGIGLERWASAFYVQEVVDADGWPGVFRESGGVVLLYAGAIYCMKYIVTATNYIIHHLSFQLFP